MGKIVYPEKSYFYEFGSIYADDINKLGEVIGSDPQMLYQSFKDTPEGERRDDLVWCILEAVEFDVSDLSNSSYRYQTCLYLYHDLISLESQGISEDIKEMVFRILENKRFYYAFGNPLSKKDMAQMLSRREPRSASIFIRDLIKYLKEINPMMTGKDIAYEIIDPKSFEDLQVKIFGEVKYKPNFQRCEEGREIFFFDIKNNKESSYKLSALLTIISGVKKV